MQTLAIFLIRFYRNGNVEYDNMVDDFLLKYYDYFNKSIDEIVDEFEKILKKR